MCQTHTTPHIICHTKTPYNDMHTYTRMNGVIFSMDIFLQETMLLWKM